MSLMPHKGGREGRERRSRACRRLRRRGKSDDAGKGGSQDCRVEISINKKQRKKGEVGDPPGCRFPGERRNTRSSTKGKLRQKSDFELRRIDNLPAATVATSTCVGKKKKRKKKKSGEEKTRAK